ncbi:metal-dependent hydrolase [Paenibacillus turpanensis]|uniref:metal-dependent hydrolase n=1 Tax=Paenibacillus turpanensis TaxID=2689078 RepID=UPI001408907C|nr:metal-dependent hydrolase [Paenibacillus turpanensis]
MDTGTHLVVGLGLAGLAYLDPAVAANPTAASAVMLGTVLGSQAPDIDTLLRLRSNASYIRNHRGMSHSVPAWFLWTGLITVLLMLLYPSVSPALTAKWVLIAVVLHVFSDLFNTYGTQAMRPFTDKWISWNVIHIFDPFIFLSHVAAIALWLTGIASPGPLFAILYIFIAVYYGWRTIVHAILERRMPVQDSEYEPGDTYMLVPTVNLQNWNIVKQKKDGSYVLGDLRSGSIRWEETAVCSSHPAAAASKTHPDVSAFLYFSRYACSEVKEHRWGYEVRWADVRYQHRKNFPFVAVLLLDHQYKPMDSYVGWLNEEKLEKKLKLSSF